MTTMELNAVLLRELSIIASDESLLEDVISYIRRLRRNKKKAEKESQAYISKEELLAGIDAGLKDVKEGRTRPMEELLKELEDGM